MCHAIVIAYLSLRKMMGIYSEGMLISAVHEVLKLLMVDDKIFAGVKLYYNWIKQWINKKLLQTC